MFLVPGYLLQMCYGMNTALTAVMTPQLMDNRTEFEINESEEGWIVSIDNVVVVIISIFSGIFQTQYGPMKVVLNYRVVSNAMSGSHVLETLENYLQFFLNKSNNQLKGYRANFYFSRKRICLKM